MEKIAYRELREET